MTVTRIILAAIIAAISAPALAGDGIIVGYKNVVTPEPDLVDFTGEIRRSWISAKRFDPSARDRFFAPTVKTFMKNETPFQSFEPRDDITSDYLMNAVVILRARKGSIPDKDRWRDAQGALSEIGRQVVRDPVWGTLPEVPGMICAGAAFDVDQGMVAKFARMQGVRIDALVLSKQAIPLYAGKTQKSEFLGNVPPLTLMVLGKDDVAKEDWHPIIASTGVKGYADNTMLLEKLAQKHVCFTRVNGEYRISALFGYGF